MTNASQEPIEGAICRLNISGPGRRRRRNIAAGLALLSVAVFVGLVASHASAWMRLLMALPTAYAAILGLQVTRNTCLTHAAAGTFEHEDFSATKMDAALAEASRRVAASIYRDGILIGLVSGLVGFASAWFLP